MRTFLLLLSSVSFTLSQAQLDMGLKAHWTFAGGSTSDMSGNAHNGTVVGNATPTVDRAGNTNCAYLFPGEETTYIDIPAATDFDIIPTGAFTISLWYQGGSPDPGDLEWLVRKRDSAPEYYACNYGLALYDVNRALYTSGEASLWEPSIPPIPDLQWHDLVGIYSNGTHQFWLDGQQIGSDASQTEFVTQSPMGITIGQRFEGAIDDIRFYDRALSSAEVALLFAEQGSCAVSTGIDEATERTITIAPNPTTDRVVVQLGDNVSPDKRMLDLFDATGRSVRHVNATTNSVTLDLSDLPKGLYLLRCGTGADALVRRITKD